MKLLLINPNTTQAMTDAIAEAARAVASPGTEIVAVQPSFGPASIETLSREQLLFILDNADLVELANRMLTTLLRQGSQV